MLIKRGRALDCKQKRRLPAGLGAYVTRSSSAEYAAVQHAYRFSAVTNNTFAWCTFRVTGWGATSEGGDASRNLAFTFTEAACSGMS
jgi:hypothetical protein